ncbi:MAG: ABC transporter permease [Chloroflexi bacterium]|nr:ABC transporter permease [Chloroflexota bacterium]
MAAVASSRQARPLARLGVLARRKPLGALGALVVLFVVAVALLAPAISPYDPLKLDMAAVFLPPGQVHPLGTDDLGRDILSRIIWGARISLSVSLLSVALGDSVGTVLGLTSGYFGGKYDLFLQRALDALMAFPSLVLALTVVAVLGASVNNVILAIAVTRAPFVARIMRSSALQLKEVQFIEAARAIGGSDARILLRHILPNAFAPLIIVSSAGLATSILIEAALSFLGLGAPPPTPSWGAMLTGAAQNYVTKAPWMAIFPGLAITLPVFGFNLLGDALRDVLDPRLRRG